MVDTSQDVEDFGSDIKPGDRVVIKAPGSAAGEVAVVRGKNMYWSSQERGQYWDLLWGGAVYAYHESNLIRSPYQGEELEEVPNV